MLLVVFYWFKGDFLAFGGLLDGSNILLELAFSFEALGDLSTLLTIIPSPGSNDGNNFLLPVSFSYLSSGLILF